jgi:hypothetical protein
LSLPEVPRVLSTPLEWLVFVAPVEEWLVPVLATVLVPVELVNLPSQGAPQRPAWFFSACASAALMSAAVATGGTLS